MPEYESLTASPFDRLDPRSTALFVIDMQRYFVRPEYPLGKWIQQVDPAGSSAYFERVKQVVVPSTVARRERRGRRSPERRPWHSAESCMIEDLGLL